MAQKYYENLSDTDINDFEIHRKYLDRCLEPILQISIIEYSLTCIRAFIAVMNGVVTSAPYTTSFSSVSQFPSFSYTMSCFYM